MATGTTNTSSEKVYIILLINTKGQMSKMYGAGREQYENVTLPAGTLMSLARVIQFRNGEEHGLFVTLDTVTTAICYDTDFRRIDRDELQLLLSIPDESRRFEVYLDEAWMEEGKNFKPDDMVAVTLDGDRQVAGHIRYKGQLDGRNGIYFGVELHKSTGIGNTDGSYHSKQYFKCPDNCGVFTTLADIRILNATSPSPDVPPVSIDVPTLSLGDRVVWIGEKEEYGTVRWIGLLKGRQYRSLNDVTVGVEFDNPVGTGTGRVGRYRLFNTAPKHASLIPMIGLIKHDEYESRLANQENFQNVPQSHQPLTDDERHLNDIRQVRQKRFENRENRNKQLLAQAQESDEISLPNVISMTKHTNKQIKDSDLEVGSLAEVTLSNPPTYGVIKWIGVFDDQQEKLIAGLEMENEAPMGSDGTFRKVRLFSCSKGKAVFVPFKHCRPDQRFLDAPQDTNFVIDFGEKESPDISGNIKPPDISRFRSICGRNKGIQGHHNSCYLDATLVSMFFFTHVFDAIFYRPRRDGDVDDYVNMQATLKDGIVNPLRRNFYVRADKIMKFRELLDKVGSVTGMCSEEKDPEEFLNLFLSHIMKAEAFIKLSSGSECFCYQLFFEKDERLKQPTTQQLFERTFQQSNHKLSQTPACLILQMPRHGKDFKMYDRIIPSLELDITDVLEEAPRECCICGRLAELECKQCYGHHSSLPDISLISYCTDCSNTTHRHSARTSHRPQPIKIPEIFRRYYNAGHFAEIPREKMELTAVMCIATSHYVTFVKFGYGDDAPWVFFDSMADRIGGRSGYNVPEISQIHDFVTWLSKSNQERIMQLTDRELNEHLRRLVCDSYMCFYQNADAAKFV